MKKKGLLITAILLFIVLVVSIVTVQLVQNRNAESSEITTDPIGDKDLLVYLGEENAANEILLVFDYSCPHCHRWIHEIFPAVKEWIEEGNVKFRTQSMVYLNQNSLELSKLDQNIKRYYPEQYFDVFFTLIEDVDDPNWATDHYIKEIINKNQLDNERVLVDPVLDVINVTRKYTRELDIESVPTIFVNGKKVQESFSIDEIQSYLKK